MTNELAAAMRRATELTRAFDLNGATKVIQDALAGRAMPSPPADPTEHPRLPDGDRTPAPPVVIPKALGGRLLRPLSEVVRTLKNGRATLLKAPRPGHPRPAVPEGAQFLARSFACAHGARQYKLFIPAGRDDAPRGLIVMLHGCQQNPDDFATGTKMNAIACANNLVVAYPSQPQSANAAGCWNWFAPAHQMRDRGEPAILAGITRELMTEFGLGRDRVFVAGLSAGGAMAAVMLETYPDLFSGAGIHSGLAYGSANDVMSAFAAMKGDATNVVLRKSDKQPFPVRTIIFQGNADGTVNPKNARRIVDSKVNPQWAASSHSGEANGQTFNREVFTQGKEVIELWSIAGAGHAWSGGDSAGSYASQKGPDASAEMIRFFLD